MGVDHVHSQLTHGPLKLALRLFPPVQLFFHAGCLGRAIGRVFVQIDTARNPVALDPAPNYLEPAPSPHAIEERTQPRPCWSRRPCSPSRPTSGLALPTSHGAIRPTAPSRQSSAAAAATADAVWLSAVCRAIGLDAAIGAKSRDAPDLMTFVQLLTGQSRPIVGVMLLKQPQYLLLGLVRNPPVRGLASSAMQNAPVSFCLNSFHQPPHLSRAQSRHFGRLLLTDPLLQGLTNQVESLDLARFHPQ